MRIISTVVLLATSVLLARTMGPDGLGAYTFAFSVVSLVVLLPQMGFPQLTVREVSRQLQLGRTRLLARYLRHANIVILALGCLVASTIAIFLLSFGRSYIASWQILLVGLPLIALYPLMAQASGVLKGTGRVVQGVLGPQLYRPTLFLLLLLAWWATGSTLHPVTVMALHGLASFVVLLEMRHRVKGALPELGKPSLVPTRRVVVWSKSAVMLSGVVIVQLLNAKIDILALGLLTNDTKVGLYAIGIQLSQAAAAIVMIGATVVAPRISQASVLGDEYLTERLCRQSAQMSLLGAVALLIAAYIAGRWLIVTAFGPQYEPAWGPLMFLLIGHMMSAFFGPVGVLLNMRGEEFATLKVTFFAALINVALNALLIPRYGLSGAAFSTTISMLAWNMLLSLRAWSLWQINTSALPFSKREAPA